MGPFFSISQRNNLDKDFQDVLEIGSNGEYVYKGLEYFISRKKLSEEIGFQEELSFKNIYNKGIWYILGILPRGGIGTIDTINNHFIGPEDEMIKPFSTSSGFTNSLTILGDSSEIDYTEN